MLASGSTTAAREEKSPGGGGGGGDARGTAVGGEEGRRQFWRSEYNPQEFASVRRPSERVTLNLR